jgi:hypothetical protein
MWLAAGLLAGGCGGEIVGVRADAQSPSDGLVPADGPPNSEAAVPSDALPFDAAPPGSDGGPPPGPDGGPLPGQDGGPPPGQDGGPPPTGFRFIAWADTKDGTDVLTALSGEAAAFSPDLTIYPGDLVPSGFNTTDANAWRDAANGGGANNLSAITFPTRGNHDTGATSTWQSYFDVQGIVTAVGATNYAYMDDALTYSFDFGNAHFIGIDVLGDVTLMTTPELTWVDDDLAQAEVRGLTHAFLFWHGPLYPVGGHCCPSDSAVIDILNKHPIVSATFHGHEHNLAWVHIGTGRYSNVTHEFEEFVVGGAGAGLYSCQAGRSDWCQDTYGFAVVDLDGSNFSVTIYEQANATPIFTRSFTK